MGRWARQVATLLEFTMAATLGGAGAATAQQPLWTLQGSEPYEILGHAFATLPDMNGNGHAELVISSLGRRVEIRDGADGTLISTLLPPFPLNTFGHAVANAGDIDADGVDDVIVGAPEREFIPCATACLGPTPGHAFVYSGASGSVLLALSLPGSPDDDFGWDVVGVGDVDHDAHDDVAVSTPFTYDGLHSRPGLVRVYSGLDGHTLWTFAGEASAENYGFSLAALGDVDGDGLSELAIGAPAWGGPGVDQADHVQVRSIVTGALLAELPAVLAWGSGFGYDLSPAGDVDGDGTPDLLVAVATNQTKPGEAHVYSGSTWTEILDVIPQTPKGYFSYQWLTAFRVAGGDDVDGDGRPDVLVGFQDYSALAIHDSDGTYVSALGTFLFVDPNGLHPKYWGTVPAMLPDVTGDGVAEVVIGEPLLWPAGRVTVYPGGHWPWKNLGHELPGTAGDWPGLTGMGSLTAGSTVVLKADKTQIEAPIAIGWLVIGATEITHAFKGGVLVPDPDLLILVDLPHYKVTHIAEGYVPAGLPPGLPVTFQLLVTDPGGPQGLTFSNAVRATLP